MKAKTITKAAQFPEKLYVSIEGEAGAEYLDAVDGRRDFSETAWVNGQRVAIYKRIDVRVVKKTTEFI